MLIVPTALVFLFFGWECASRLARGRESAPLERATWALSIAMSTWLGSLWLLALAQMLHPAPLIGRTILFAVAAVAMRMRRPFGFKLAPMSPAVVAVAVAILAWTVFMLWRGTIIPPLSHDALSYHLPKAVFYARAGGFEVFDLLDPRARDLPANYELLLSEFIALDASDALTEWLSTLFYFGFVVAAGALAQRWWPRAGGGAVAAVVILTAGVPVVLLHSGAHKNDLMTAFCVVAALVAAGRWLTTGERFAMLLAIAMFAMAVGTKPNGALPALALIPFLAWRWWRIPHRWRELAVAVGFAVVAFALLGGAVYSANATRRSGPTSVAKNDMAMSNVAFSIPVVYGDWSNLWQAPYVLLAAPFSGQELALWVPWESKPWFWRRYDMYISHAGVPFVLCALALPFVVMRSRRDDGPAMERMAVTVACLVAVLVMLPVVFSPHGFYAISLPRYIAFLYPVIFAWVVPVVAKHLSRPAAVLMLTTAILSFVFYGLSNIAFDDFVPLAYLKYAREHPGTRVIPFDPNRAASVVDRAAGPTDRIAFEAAFGAWLHPAFGVGLRRPVDLIRPSTNVPQIPDAAKWVVVDRGYDVIWGSRDLHDLSEVQRYGWRGQSPEGAAIIGSLLRDRRFEVVFYNPRKEQAVFRRVR
jgi:hypothetical protein